jgi:nitrogen-specific signal transduction histidine kinase
VLNNAGQFHQVMINLVVNASEAIGSEMATITIALGAAPFLGWNAKRDLRRRYTHQKVA